MREAGLVVLRRHHPDIVGERARDALQRRQALGVDAVVIGQQDAHRRRPHFASIFVSPPM